MKRLAWSSFPAVAALATALAPSVFAQAAFAQAVVAQESAAKKLATPQSEVEVGIGGVFPDDAKSFGRYNGLTDAAPYGILQGTFVRRDDATGTWVRLEGRNLGLDDRGLRFEHERQGDWFYFIDVGQTPMNNPKSIVTPLAGIGDIRQFVTGSDKKEVELGTTRDKLKLGFGKDLGYKVDVRAGYRGEHKRGDRQWGSSGINFLAEPIDFLTQEAEASVAYAGDDLQMVAGYLGSFFTNDAEALTTNGGQPNLALAPDNQAHQGYLSGGYNFTPTTRGTFKFSFTRAIQNEDFFRQPDLEPAHLNLDGKVDSTLAQVNLSTRPFDDLTLRASLRYDDRQDDTDTAQYVTAGINRTGWNIAHSRTTKNADVEASYRLPLDFRLTGGVKYENWERTYPPERQVSFREETDEGSTRIELRRSLTDSLAGAVSYIYSNRQGSKYLSAADARIDPIHWADRERNKWRLNFDWVPIEALSFQMLYEGSEDTYDERFLGPRKGQSQFGSVDASYDLTKDWNLNGWFSYGQVTMEQGDNGSGAGAMNTTITAADWVAELVNRSTALGAGVKGKITPELTIGANVQLSLDTSEHNIATLSGPSLGEPLPDINYRRASLELNLDYAVWQDSGFRLGYGFIHTETDDWTWKYWVYGDGTIVKIPTQENTHYVALTYYMRW